SGRSRCLVRFHSVSFPGWLNSSLPTQLLRLFVQNDPEPDDHAPVLRLKLPPDRDPGAVLAGGLPAVASKHPPQGNVELRYFGRTLRVDGSAASVIARRVGGRSTTRRRCLQARIAYMRWRGNSLRARSRRTYRRNRRT